MNLNDYDQMNEDSYDIAWCPSCGNFALREIMKQVLSELNLDPSKTVMISGIGQAAKMPQYLKLNFFNGLHGRALPVALAIKASNPELTVIAESGDGCMYGEGGNHFLHTINRNPDITMLAHNNMVYGLTKGQASPTSQLGFETPIQTVDRSGVTNNPLNPIALALSQGASFVARAYVGDMDKTKEIIKKAITHKGFAFVDIFQPCVTYNKVNTFGWFKENTYYLEEEHDSSDIVAAFNRSLEIESLPLGIFYTKTNQSTFEEKTLIYKHDDRPLYMREVDIDKLRAEIEAYKHL